MYLTLKEVERYCSRPGACIFFFFPVKGQIVITFGSWVGGEASWNHSTLPLQHKNSHGHPINEWAWLCVTTTHHRRHEISCFTCHAVLFSFWFFQPFTNVKPMRSAWAAHKQEVGWSFSVSHPGQPPFWALGSHHGTKWTQNSVLILVGRVPLVLLLPLGDNSSLNESTMLS